MTASTELAKTEQPGALARQDDLGIDIEHLIARVAKVREVRDRVMTLDIHYGTIPGVKKPSLFKPGAETLCLAFQLAPKFHIDERWDGDHLECVVTCTLVHVPSGTEVGQGIGSCSTMESKYAYRKGERTCPECGKATLIKGKPEYEKEERFKGGWLCFAKKGGCGAKFVPGDPAIDAQMSGRVENEDIADAYNTVRKMGCKRAHVAATLFVTGASELFTQDVEDMPQKAQQPAPAPRANGGGKAAAPPVQAVPSDADLEKALAEIAAIPTVDGLGAHAQANRGKRWSKAQVEALKTASAERKALLEDPDYLGDPEPPEGV